VKVAEEFFESIFIWGFLERVRRKASGEVFLATRALILIFHAARTPLCDCPSRLRKNR
jgi:hypothetical protein